MNISRRLAAAVLVAAVAAGTPARAADRRSVIMPVPGQPYFVQLAPIFVPVIDNNGSTRQVSIALALELADGAQLGGIEGKQHLLDDAFLGDLYLYVQQRGGIGVPNAERALKERLRQTAQRVLDPVKVKEVEIEEFFEQRR